jgi:O-methyltransferase
MRVRPRLKALAKGLGRAFGLEISRATPPGPPPLPVDFSEDLSDVVKRVSPFTLTSPERIYALFTAAQYVVRAKVPGDVVECGVWRGGSVMAMAMALMKAQDTSRAIHLFDTFDGMTPPSTVDLTFSGEPAALLLQNTDRVPGSRNFWAWATREDVEANLRTTGYPFERFNIVAGDVCATLQRGSLTQPIALLHLDTDWYASIRHELDVLYPQVSEGGVVIVDDYGHWRGARLAVDEFLEKLDAFPYLHRSDYTGRLFIKR